MSVLQHWLDFLQGLSLGGTLSLLGGDRLLGRDTGVMNSTRAHHKLETTKRDTAPRHFRTNIAIL